MIIGDSNDVNYELAGNAGADQLAGAGGHDKLAAGTGDDFLIGNGGNNTLSGGSGNDTLIGGEGRDKLIGGLGDDIYVINSSLDKIEERENEGIDTGQSRLPYALARLRTHIQNKTIAASTHADRKMSARRSKRMAILRQPLSRPNMFSTLWRFL